ncbi:MAG: dihydroneopterin aldolase [Rikenellaceae bacterium]
MNYQIELREMEFRAFHGCYDMEQKVGNRFSVNVVVTAPLGEVAASDDVTKAVSYLTVYEIVEVQMCRTQRTIEAVAVNVIEAIKGQYPEVVSVKCEVSKLAPPLGGKVARATVVITL